MISVVAAVSPCVRLCCCKCYINNEVWCYLLYKHYKCNMVQCSPILVIFCWIPTWQPSPGSRIECCTRVYFQLMCLCEWMKSSKERLSNFFWPLLNRKTFAKKSFYSWKTYTMPSSVCPILALYTLVTLQESCLLGCWKRILINEWAINKRMETAEKGVKLFKWVGYRSSIIVSGNNPLLQNT